MFNKELRAGFTTIELVIVIAIIAVLSTIASLSYSAWSPNLQLSSSSRSLYMDFQLAKREAIKRNTNVVINISSVDCSTTLPDSVPTPGGSYTIFVDDGTGGGTAGNGTLDGNEETLSSTTIPSHVALCQNTFTGNIGFLPNNLPLSIGTITLNNDTGRKSELSVSIAGNIRVN